MRNIKVFFEKGMTIPLALGASALLGVVALFGFAVLPNLLSPLASMTITPEQKVVEVGEAFLAEIRVTASRPVNVFTGELRFDNDILVVESIDYNTSIADLWAERPWYSNGEGTLNFIGGTTKPGGFFGTGALIKVTFRTLTRGSSALTLNDVHILEHNGLGTEVTLNEPIDTIITVTNPEIREANLVAENDPGSTIEVVERAPPTDLNGDGKQSIADVSIFMLHVAGDDERYDFNDDGKVNLVDLNILLGTM